MILAVAAAIALSIAHQASQPTPVAAPPQAASAQPGAVKQPDPYQYRKLPLGAFDRVKVSGPFKVAVIVGTDTSRIELVGPPALLADTIATVEGGTLVIRFREGATWSWNPGSGVNAVAFAPNLTAVRLERSGEVEVGGPRGDLFSASSDGSGSILVRQLDVGHVELATSGAGGITVEGSARDGTYVVDGAGSIDAKRLRVESASIAIGGSGSAFADVSKTANISVTGTGRVDLVGGAACIEQPAHSPQVQCR